MSGFRASMASSNVADSVSLLSSTTFLPEPGYEAHSATGGLRDGGQRDRGQREGGSSYCGSAVTNPTSIHEDVGSIPGLAQWVKDLA